jgi:RecJ-like exonuclease
MADWITHEEDVWWDFRGDDAEDLEPGRYYEGTVDGFAEFGVFVDLGNDVTGLLHKSELDTRLESLDWDPGDTVFVQVTDVRDNGNVDLGWSIRQEASEFRGARVHDPDAPDDQEPQRPSSDGDDEPTVTRVDATGGSTASDSSEPEDRTDDRGNAKAVDSTPDAEEAATELNRAAVDALGDRVGDTVRLDGRVVDAHQTSGPTVFELKDETGTVECAAFVEAGVRAYPEVEVDDVVRLVGEVERRHGELQVETGSMTELEGDEREEVERRLAAAIESEATALDEDLLAVPDAPAGVEAVKEQIRDAATAIRRAVKAARPVVVRHSSTADGYAAGAAIERAVLPMVREEHPSHDAEYHFFERRPLEDGVYDMNAATSDVTDMLESRDRHGEPLPLLVLVDAGGTRDSAPGYGMLDVYGVDRVVVTDGRPDPEVTEEVDAIVNPFLAEELDRGDATSTALAANVAAHVEPSVRDDVSHLPAVSYWDDTPDAYVDLAAQAGFDPHEIERIRQAIAFEAYYQSYEDKREIVENVLFDADEGFVGHLSDQFLDRLEDELDTAERNLGIREAQGTTFAVLDTEAYTHRFDFPPTDLLLDELHRRHAGEYDRLVTIGFDEDDLRFRTTDPVDLRAVGEGARERAPDAGITVVGGSEGRIEFLVGERDAVLEAVVAALADELSG